MGRLYTKDEERIWWDQVRSHPGASFWHLYTKPPENGLIISDEESLNVAVSYMAIAAKETDVTILAYAIMSNHFHWLIRSAERSALIFFKRFQHLMDVYLSRHGKGKTIRMLSVDKKEITSLRQFRDEVAYILRNPYAVRSDINIMSNSWTSSFLYFNPIVSLLPSTPGEQLSKREKRSLLKSSSLTIPSGASAFNGKIYPASFVDFKTVELLFTNARKYTQWLLKNVESQVEVSLRYGEDVNIPDEELSPIVWKYCKDHFGNTDTRSLQAQQMTDLLREFKYNYHTSNAQLARLTDIPLKTIDSFFPPA